MSVLARDPAEVTSQLERWLRDVQGLEDPSVGELEMPAATGWSNETILFAASWRDGGQTVHRELVARIAPSEYTVFPDDTFVGQFHVMAALARHDVPVARVHWIEHSPTWFGEPFWIMDRVRGEIPTDAPPYASGGWLHDASPADQERAWWSGVRAMASIHSIAPERLDADLSLLRSGDGSPAAQLDHLERYLAWAEEGTPHPAVRRALEVLRRELPPAPAEGLALSWGDARFSNLIFRDFEVAAVLDWEMASIGDPLLDLGWWLFADETLSVGTGASRLAGFPSAEQTARQWTEWTGRDASALSYYLLFAGVRFSIIMLRMGTLLHGLGLVDADFARSNFICEAMSERLASW